MADKTWITSSEAASLMSEINGREISTDYVRLLGRKGLIKTRSLDQRTKLFSRADCARYQVKQKRTAKGEASAA